MQVCSSCQKEQPFEMYIWDDSKQSWSKTCSKCRLRYKQWYDRQGRVKKEQKKIKKNYLKFEVNSLHESLKLSEKHSFLHTQADDLLKRCHRTTAEAEAIICRYNKNKKK